MALYMGLPPALSFDMFYMYLCYCGVVERCATRTHARMHEDVSSRVRRLVCSAIAILVFAADVQLHVT